MLTLITLRQYLLDYIIVKLFCFCVCNILWRDILRPYSHPISHQTLNFLQLCFCISVKWWSPILFHMLYNLTMIFFDSQIEPDLASKTPQVEFCVLLIVPSFFKFFFALWANNNFQGHPVLFLLQPGILHFSKEIRLGCS